MRAGSTDWPRLTMWRGPGDQTDAPTTSQIEPQANILLHSRTIAGLVELLACANPPIVKANSKTRNVELRFMDHPLSIKVLVTTKMMTRPKGSCVSPLGIKRSKIGEGNRASGRVKKMLAVFRYFDCSNLA